MGGEWDEGGKGINGMKKEIWGISRSTYDETSL